MVILKCISAAWWVGTIGTILERATKRELGESFIRRAVRRS